MHCMFRLKRRVFTQLSYSNCFSRHFVSIFTQLVSSPSARKSLSILPLSFSTCDLSNMQSEKGGRAEYFFLLRFERRFLHGKLPLTIYGLPPRRPRRIIQRGQHITGAISGIEPASLPPSRGDEDIFWREKNNPLEGFSNKILLNCLT